MVGLVVACPYFFYEISLGPRAGELWHIYRYGAIGRYFRDKFTVKALAIPPYLPDHQHVSPWRFDASDR
jgi:hypothetical protein